MFFCEYKLELEFGWIFVSALSNQHLSDGGSGSGGWWQAPSEPELGPETGERREVTLGARHHTWQHWSEIITLLTLRQYTSEAQWFSHWLAILMCNCYLCFSLFCSGFQFVVFIQFSSHTHLDEVAARCCWILIGEKSNICTSASRVTLLTNFPVFSLVKISLWGFSLAILRFEMCT